MSRTIDELKKLAVKCTSATCEDDCVGNTIDTVLDYVAENYTAGSEVAPQTGKSGKFLTTNGTTTSWEDVEALPTQEGQNGKYLTTNGTSASWGEVAGSPVIELTGTEENPILFSDLSSGYYVISGYICFVGIFIFHTDNNVPILMYVDKISDNNYPGFLLYNAVLDVITIKSTNKRLSSWFNIVSGFVSENNISTSNLMDCIGRYTMDFDSSKTQVLKNVNGGIKWVEE